MEPLTVLLVEDDPAACSAFLRYADELDDVKLLGVTNNAGKALQDIQDYLPHAVILDLELHQGSGSGLDVLRGIREAMLPVNPYVLVTTNNSSPVTYEYARQLGTDFILSKHQADYSERAALDFLRMMSSVIQSKWKSLPDQAQTTESPKQREQRITRRIMTELDQVGISPKVKGYQYLADAIRLIVDKPQQHLCNTIGEKYGKTEASVERAMQNAINKAWRTTDIDELLHHFKAKIHSDKGVPSITEFVYYYANRIKNEY